MGKYQTDDGVTVEVSDEKAQRMGLTKADPKKAAPAEKPNPAKAASKPATKG